MLSPRNHLQCRLGAPTAALLVVSSAFLAVPAPRANAKSRPGRIGVVVETPNAAADAASAALQSAPWDRERDLAGSRTGDTPSSAGPRDAPSFHAVRASANAASLEESIAAVALEGVGTIVAITDVPMDARTSPGRGIVIRVSPSGAAPAEVSGAPSEGDIRRAVSSVLGSASRIVLVSAGMPVPGTDSKTGRFSNAPALALVTALPGADPDAVRAVREQVASGCQAVWFLPDVPASTVEAVCAALAGGGVLAGGSRREHLDAGAAMIDRVSAVDLGRLAAVACVAASETGRLPSVGAPLRPATRSIEIHLGHARRLGVRVPLPCLVAADRIVREPEKIR